MNKTKRTCLSLLLSFAVGFTMLFGSAGFAQAASYDKTKAIFEACGDYIYTTVKEPTVGTLGGEWVLYGLSHAGYDMSDSYRDTYLANVEKELKENSYPGRGIVIGRSADGKHAVTAYFIMGRSENSRNRIFVEDGEGIRTQAFDPSKLTDPSLIIYAPVRVLGNKTIVTNGDQTDTIYEGMDRQLTFEQSLRSREFEPDAPNYTPRISGIMHIDNGTYNYAMSILKSNNGNPDSCNRYTFAYQNPVAGEAHFIHTYMGDGNPLPSFEGEPKLVGLEGDIDTFTSLVWENLNEENKVSLFVRYIDIETGKYETRIVNKNK